jgi:hypothetical protein
MNDPHNLSRAMAAAEAATAPQASPPVGSEVERLIATGDRLLRVQQARLAQGYADHEKQRTERQNWYRTEMRRLTDEAEHELLMLDKAWDDQRRPIEAMIAKLKAMRAA